MESDCTSTLAMEKGMLDYYMAHTHCMPYNVVCWCSHSRSQPTIQQGMGEVFEWRSERWHGDTTHHTYNNSTHYYITSLTPTPCVGDGPPSHRSIQNLKYYIHLRWFSCNFPPPQPPPIISKIVTMKFFGWRVYIEHVYFSASGAGELIWGNEPIHTTWTPEYLIECREQNTV